jgi:transcriptional regulator of arginine metabolism
MLRTAKLHNPPPNCIVGAVERSGTQPARTTGTTRIAKRDRQRAMRELVSRVPIASQQEFTELLAERGFDVTQATVSRDIAELGLVKVVRADRHVYASPEDLAPAPARSNEALRRLLADLPVTIRRSGLILLLISTPGTANAIAQAIDESDLHEQEGTLAGDNTLLVLFADEEQLLRWQGRVERLRSPDAVATAGPLS